MKPMKPMTTPSRQRGVTLIVGLIMLVLITLMVTSAFMLSNTNLKAVGNMQFRDEAIAAANVAIERVVSEDFTLAPQAKTEIVDIGGAAYTVNVAKPACIRSVAIKLLPKTDPDYSTCIAGEGVILCYQTVWEIEATVSPAGAAAATGAVATVKQGISKRVNVTAASSCI
jgi:Tfp pilus assembly protein PilX